MKILPIICGAIYLGGCVSAMPNFINGKYYMAGDKSCSNYRILSDSRIMCINKKGEETGYRDAMSNQQLQMYMYQQQQEQQLIQQNRPTNTNCYRTYSGMNCTTY